MKATGIGVKGRALTYVTILLCLLSFAKAAGACTGIRLSAEDGTVIHARTLEFGIGLDSSVLFVPRGGYGRIGTTPEGDDGITWKSWYASLDAHRLRHPDRTAG